MLKSVLNKVKIIPSYFYRNYITPHIYSIRDRKVLARNLELKNKYTGQRCFLIGGGPSVNDIDLSLLNREYTFVVNEFEKNKQYNSLKPKFHVIADNYNEGAPEYWRERFKAKDSSIPTETTVITGVGAIPIIKKCGLFKNHRVYYVGMQGIFTNNIPFNIDLDRYVPYPKNSILLCMMIAVWMGFSEIYLLGCEHSFLAQPLGKDKSLGWSHSYKDETTKLSSANTDILKKYISKKELNSNYETIMINMLQLFRSYKLFYTKALKAHPNLKIFNATPNSFLDVFPYKEFHDIKIK